MTDLFNQVQHLYALRKYLRISKLKYLLNQTFIISLARLLRWEYSTIRETSKSEMQQYEKGGKSSARVFLNFYV